MSLTVDQSKDFDEMKANLIQEIKTDTAFTELQKEETIKLVKKNEDEGFYLFLRNRPSAKAVKLYVEGLTRRTKDRVKEAERAARHPAAHKETFENEVKAAIGYAKSETKDRVIKELKRLAKKSDATWKALGLNKKKTLKYFGIEG